jgi:hypothetical protein
VKNRRFTGMLQILTDPPEPDMPIHGQFMEAGGGASIFECDGSVRRGGVIVQANFLLLHPHERGEFDPPAPILPTFFEGSRTSDVDGAVNLMTLDLVQDRGGPPCIDCAPSFFNTFSGQLLIGLARRIRTLRRTRTPRCRWFSSRPGGQAG